MLVVQDCEKSLLHSWAPTNSGLLIVETTAQIYLLCILYILQQHHDVTPIVNPSSDETGNKLPKEKFPKLSKSTRCIIYVLGDSKRKGSVTETAIGGLCLQGSRYTCLRSFLCCPVLQTRLDLLAQNSKEKDAQPGQATCQPGMTHLSKKVIPDDQKLSCKVLWPSGIPSLEAQRLAGWSTI